MFRVDVDPAFGVLNKSEHKTKSSIITYHVYLNLDSVGLGRAKFVGNSNPNDFSKQKN